jgi:hypothetical protein
MGMLATLSVLFFRYSGTLVGGDGNAFPILPIFGGGGGPGGPPAAPDFPKDGGGGGGAGGGGGPVDADFDLLGPRSDGGGGGGAGGGGAGPELAGLSFFTSSEEISDGIGRLKTVVGGNLASPPLIWK